MLQNAALAAEKNSLTNPGSGKNAVIRSQSRAHSNSQSMINKLIMINKNSSRSPCSQHQSRNIKVGNT